MAKKTSKNKQAPPSEVFLSYHTPDRETVENLRRRLEARGIQSFMDRESLVAGMPWPQALEDALNRVSAAVVFIGRDGLGVWQKREMYFALDRQAQEEKSGRRFPVVPIILPGTNIKTSFLFQNTAVDLSQGQVDSKVVEALERALIHSEAAPEGEKRDLDLEPYRAMDAFREEDAALYFGREAEAEQILDRVLKKKLTAVVGPSGTGKSSLVHAGLFPLLRRQRPPSPSWELVSIQPKQSPFHQLINALLPYMEPEIEREGDRLLRSRELESRLKSRGFPSEAIGDFIESALKNSKGTDRLLLVIDQFEELFTQVPTDQRRSFVKALLEALTSARLHLLVTMRGNFFDRATAFNPQLRELLQEGTILLGPMSRDNLERAIEEPVRLVGCRFEEGLVHQIVSDASDEPGNLPLLEFALTMLWSKRRNGKLTLPAYREIGGVQGAIGRKAEEVFASLSKRKKEVIARRVFTRLIHIESEIEIEGKIEIHGMRRRVAMSELDGEEAKEVVRELATARLLVVSLPLVVEYPSKASGTIEVDGAEVDASVQVRSLKIEATVDLAHEAIIRGWDRLRKWLNDDQEFLLWRQRLRSRIEVWKVREDKDELLRGTFLAEAIQRLKKRPDELKAEKDFIEKSRNWERTQEEAKLAQKRFEEERRLRSVKRRRILKTSLAAAIGLGFLVSLYLYTQNQRQARLNLATHLTSQAQAVKDHSPAGLPLSTLVALEADRRNRKDGFPTEQAEAVIRDNLKLLAKPLAKLPVAENETVNALAVSPDGDRLAMVVGEIVRICSIDFDDRETTSSAKPRVMQFKPLGELSDQGVRSVAFSPDGRLVTAGRQGVRVGNLDNREEWSGERAIAIAVSVDGRYLAAAGKGLKLWKLGADQLLDSVSFERRVTAMALSPDGGALAAAVGSEVLVWSVNPVGGNFTNDPVFRREWKAESLAFSPDGEFLAIAVDEQVQVLSWKLQKGQVVSRVSHERHILDARLRTSTGREIGGKLVAVAFGPDDRHLITASMDKTARVWEFLQPNPDRIFWADAREVARMPHDKALLAVAYSPKGHVLTGSYATSSGWVWDVSDGLEVARFQQPYAATAVSFHPNGEELVTLTSAEKNLVRRWTIGVASTEPSWTKEPLHGVKAIGFGPGGDSIYAASADRLYRLSDETAKNWEQICQMEGSPTSMVAFSPNGRYLVKYPSDPPMARKKTSRVEIFVLEVDSGRIVGNPIELKGDTLAVAAVASGGRLALAQGDGLIRISGGSFEDILLQTFLEDYPAMAFSPQGKYLATAEGLSVRVWDLEQQRVVSHMTQDQEILALAFGSAQNATGGQDNNDQEAAELLATAGAHGTVHVWLWQTDELLPVACERLTPPYLTKTDWERFLPKEPWVEGQGWPCAPAHPSMRGGSF